MKNNHYTEIGEIESISGNILSIRLAKNIKSSMPIIDGIVYKVGQVGSFLKVPQGFSNLFGIVTQAGAAAVPEKVKESQDSAYDKSENTRWINLVLVGEQVGKKFSRGVSQFPTTSDKVHLVTIEDLNIIYGGYDDSSSIDIGNISVSESLAAKIDLDRLISRHAAILGSTGSGKSNAVGVLLESIANKNFKSSRILVIDPHGEYGEILKSKSKVFKINSFEDHEELHIPYWALPFDELMSIFAGTLTEANREYIRERIVEYKVKQSIVNSFPVDTDLITADSPVPFSLKKFWFDLDDFERQTFQEARKPSTITALVKAGDAEALKSNEYPPAGLGSSAPFLNHQAKGIQRFLESLRIKLKDSRYRFLFSPGDWTPDLNGKIKLDLGDLLYSWLGNQEPITILDLSGMPAEIMSSISGTVLKITNDALFWGQETRVGGKQQPLLIVLEEAHSYLKSGQDSISSRTVQSIAKEGRKYGVGLLLVTQRPSELDETVLSQCGTMIALRMNNTKDRSHVKAAIQDELQSIVDLLPSLRTGEAVISGEAVKIPSRVSFFKISHAKKSSDPRASVQWRNERPDKNEYIKAIKFWRDQNYKNKEE